MKAIVLGALAGAGLVMLVIGTFGPRDQAFAQWPASPPSTASGGHLIALSAEADEEHQMITVIDRQNRTFCVYHVEKATGKIALVGSRNINWDLQLMHYNNEDPLPQQIQTLLEKR